MLRLLIGYVLFLWCICGSVGCVSPSKYDVELANRQNDNMLDLMETINNQEDMLMNFIILLERRISNVEDGRIYQLAPYSTADVAPEYLKPIE
tara:strand:+ start:1720 stop:1998 length:279 start_codon:yes stop_codon:yes gene_type:complete